MTRVTSFEEPSLSLSNRTISFIINAGNVPPPLIAHKTANRIPIESIRKCRENGHHKVLINNTEKWMAENLASDADQLYIRKEARKLAASEMEKKRKAEQIQADQEKVAQNEEKRRKKEVVARKQ
jgi:hypothetical protein